MGQNHPTSVVSPKNMDPYRLYSSKYPEKNIPPGYFKPCAPCDYLRDFQCAPPNWNQKLYNKGAQLTGAQSISMNLTSL